MKTRHLLHILFLVFILLCFTNCIENKPDGDWDPIETDRSEAEIPATGGTVTVTSKNYSSWWISQVAEKTGNGPDHYIERAENEWHKIENEWCKIEVPAEAKNQVRITLTANTTKENRELSISMTVGDAFTPVKIKQGYQ